MAVSILLPTPLQRYAGDKESVDIEAITVEGALAGLVESQPALKNHIFDGKGTVRSYLNIYLGDEDTRYMQGLNTPIKEGDTLTIVPSIAGG